MIKWLKKWFIIEYFTMDEDEDQFSTQDLLNILEEKNITISQGNRIVLELLKRAFKNEG